MPQIPPVAVDITVLQNHVHLPTRCIFIEGEVDFAMSNFLARALHIMDVNPKEPINVYLTSPGGDRMAGIAAYDLLQACKANVRIIGYGEVCSSAVTVFCGGDERYLLPNTRLLIHSGDTAVADKNDYVGTTLKEYLKSSDIMYTIIGKRLGLSLKEMKVTYSKDHWLNAKEAVKMGLADGIFK